MAQALAAGASASTQTAPGQKAEEVDITAEAKRALAKIGSRDFRRVRNARPREAGTRALAALKKLARNTSKAREATLLAEFARGLDALQAAQPKPSSFETCDRQYQICMELCKMLGGNCSGCAGVNSLCYMVNLTIELVEENDLPDIP